MKVQAHTIVRAHGWLGAETLKTRLGNFEFRNSYPAGDATQQLREALVFNRAVEAYLVQMHGVSWYRVWKGIAEAGAGTPNQMVIWETLMDSATLLLTGNTETVYGLCALDLKRDGPVVIEAPAMMLGGISDLWQREIMGIGPTGIDNGKGGKFLLLPPDYAGPVPEGYLHAKASTYGAVLGVRGFQVDGKPDKAVGLMKRTRIYPLAQATNLPAMTFVKALGPVFLHTSELVRKRPSSISSPRTISTSTRTKPISSFGCAPPCSKKSQGQSGKHLSVVKHSQR